MKDQYIEEDYLELDSFEVEDNIILNIVMEGEGERLEVKEIIKYEVPKISLILELII